MKGEIKIVNVRTLSRYWMGKEKRWMASYFKGEENKRFRFSGWVDSCRCVRSQKRENNTVDCRESGRYATRSKWLAFGKLVSIEKDGKYTEDIGKSNWDEDKV